ncbi:MAG TPA: hypothetical protein GX010_00200 [Erysipelotrichaceae bacterium]|nr:hypothetical protein [Erysipelotrichaceae bacterium]
MNISLESSEKIRGLLPGLFQFKKNDYFTQAELAITDKEILIYNDHAPDEIVDETSKFYIKANFSFTEIRYLSIEKINNKELNKFGRIVIVFKNKKEEPVFFYYFVKEKKIFKKIIKLFKESRLKTRKEKVFLNTGTKIR